MHTLMIFNILNTLVGSRQSFTLLEELSLACFQSFYFIAHVCSLPCGNHFQLYWAISVSVSNCMIYSTIPITTLFIPLSSIFLFYLNSMFTISDSIAMCIDDVNRRMLISFVVLFEDGSFKATFKFFWDSCEAFFKVDCYSDSLSRKKKFLRAWKPEFHRENLHGKYFSSWKARTRRSVSLEPSKFARFSEHLRPSTRMRWRWACFESSVSTFFCGRNFLVTVLNGVRFF